MTDSPSDFANYMTLGITGMVKGALMPEDPFSKEHWENSFGAATLAVGGIKGLGSKESVRPVGVKDTGKIQESTKSPVGDVDKGIGRAENLQRGRYADRLDNLHDKYGKLTPEQINQRINLRGETKNELERLEQIYDGRPNFGKR